MPSYTVVDESVNFDKLESLARGSYQRDLIWGNATWSGADLKGKARKYGFTYEQSRKNLRERIDEHFDTYEVQTKVGGRRILVIGARSEMHAMKLAADQCGQTIVDNFDLDKRSQTHAPPGCSI